MRGRHRSDAKGQPQAAERRFSGTCWAARSAYDVSAAVTRSKRTNSCSSRTPHPWVPAHNAAKVSAHNAAIVELLDAGLVREQGLAVLLVDDEADQVGQRVLAALRGSVARPVDYWFLRRRDLLDVPSKTLDRAVRRLAALGYARDAGQRLDRRLTLLADAPVPVEVEAACRRVPQSLADPGRLAEHSLREGHVQDVALLRAAVNTLVARGQVRRERTAADRPLLVLAA